MTTATFAEFCLSEPLEQALADLGFSAPTPVQAQVLQPALEGRDLLVSAATGSGKTAAFLLPMLERFSEAPGHGVQGLVLVPTRELAQQVLRQGRQLAAHTSVPLGIVTGGAPTPSPRATPPPALLIATPGRLLAQLEQGAIDLSELQVLVLDEADRMLDMGFSPTVLAICGHAPAQRQTLLFSATLHRRGVKELSAGLLREPLTITLDAPRTQPEAIHQQLVLADDPAHKLELLVWLLLNESFERAMVFCNTRERAVRVSDLVRVRGVRAAVIHGELEPRERARVMDLLRRGEIRVLVATDVAARGLDLPGMQLVVNYDVARRGDHHLHRTGRTGRAGEAGLAVSLVEPNDWNLMFSIARYLRLDLEQRLLPGLKGRYEGPKKVKKSGKAVGKKRRERTAKGGTGGGKKGGRGAGKG